MSLSDDIKKTGTIFMGPEASRETTLEKLYENTRKDLWTQQSEDEYMDRIKARATERVRALLVQARRRGEEILGKARTDSESIMAEAARILDEARDNREEAQSMKSGAYQEGYTAGQAQAAIELAAGQAQAALELADARQALGETTALILLGIHEQCGAIFEAWREDMVELLHEVAEKSTGLILEQNRRQVLTSLLEQSMRALLDRNVYTVKVNPVDAELLTNMLAEANQARPRTSNWELATDPALDPGSLVVESSTALIDNSRQARSSVVDEVLRHLSLPFGPADQEAVAKITNTLVTEMRKNGVTFTQEAGPDDPETEPEEAPMPDLAAAYAPDPDAEAGLEAEAAPVGQEEILGSGESGETVAGTVSYEETPEAGRLEDMSQAEAQNLVAHFLDVPEAGPAGAEGEPASLPAELADELLADMGFAPDKE